MPVLTLDLDVHGRPIVELYVSACSAERDLSRAEGRPIVPSLLVRALVDTGAGRSHVDLGKLGWLALSPVSEGFIYTASGTGRLARDVYLVDVDFAGGRPAPIAADLPVFGSRLADDLRVDMLLGRDVLERCELIYDGIRRRFTLTW